MELPEQDRQALIEAARRRGVTGKGGAAFGVMPSSGKRPKEPEFPLGSSVLDVPIGGKERLTDTVLRRRPEPEASMTALPAPSMAQRHARSLEGYLTPKVGGPRARTVSQSLLGGQESVLPFGIGLQEFVPFSPYVGEEAGAMVREGQETDSGVTTGLGLGLGALQAFPVAKPLARGAKAAGKALGPKAAEMAEGYLLKSGLAPSVIKPKGGNWLSGSVEGATKPLVPKPGARGRPASETMQEMEATYPPDVLQRLSPETAETVNRSFAALKPDVAVEDWINTKLNKYIKNEMGTPEDPVRALAERGVTHLPEGNLERAAEWTPDTLGGRRRAAGFPKEGYATTPAGQGWEQLADEAIHNMPASERIKQRPAGYQDEDTWLDKVPPETMTYGVYRGIAEGDELGLPHLIDELRNATRADSDLPANLRWKPEDLKKVTVPQAVERVAKINEWRAAQKVEADAAKARNPATFTVKEYPEQKMQWVQLKMPPRPEDVQITNDGINYVVTRGDEVIGRYASERTANQIADKVDQSSLEDALKYEGDTMGHCVGGYCPDVESGKSRIYSLRDKKGEPHVTIEVGPRSLSQLTKTEAFDVWTNAGMPAEDFSRWYTGQINAPQSVLDALQNQPAEIIQIKGKGNRAPKEEYLPMVQDFVRSGNWSSVGDFKNTGLYRKGDFIDEFTPDQLDAVGKGEYLTMDEIKKLREGKAWKPIDTDADWGDVDVDLPPRAYARGGLVTDTDAIAAKLKSTGMDDQKAFMQALRMADARQEAHMAGGGLAKLLKGAKTIGNYQALPLNLPRAPNLPPQEITKTAERVARQQMGQHVRQSDKIAANLAGRSVKEADKLQKMQVDIQPTKEVMQSVVVPEEVGQVRIALPGDISVADQMLMEVEGLPIGSVQEGGAKYGLGKQDLDDPRFWASNEGPAQIFQNKVTDLSYMYETPEIMALHLAMGHDAMNFAQHFADANLLAIQASNVHPKAAEMFNKMIREGYEKINPKTKEKVRITFPDFPGIEDYQQAYKATQENPELRKWFNDRMKKESITTPLGIPSGKEIEYAIMEPALRNMEHSMTGLSVGRMKPGASLIPGSSHKTYSHDIAGQALGHTKELTPIELAFPDASAYIKSTKRPQDFTPTIQKLFPHQVVDEQYINQLGEYYNRLKQIRGYKKGGEVKKTGLSVLNEAII
jgi:hypothetical protein